MARTRLNIKGRRERGRFLAMPQSVLASPAWCRLSAHAIKVIMDLGAQYNGKNNGDLCAAWTIMQPRGWKSRTTLTKALREAVSAGFITITRQGGRHLATLYALTWFGIDHCDGKLDIGATSVPLNTWKNNSLAQLVDHIAPAGGPINGNQYTH